MSQACGFEGCGKVRRVFGLCTGHAQQRHRGGSLSPLRSRRPTGSSLARDGEGRKECSRCGEWLTEGAFPPFSRSPDGLNSWCRDCLRDYRLTTKYGISLEAMQQLLAAQGGGCAVCGTTAPPTKKGWSVDHDHSCCSGRLSCGACVRGVLCQPCNIGLGAFRDDVDRLLAGAEYISKWNERRDAR